MIPATVTPRHAMKAPELMSATERPAVWATAASVIPPMISPTVSA
jgi:hypothetical protein